MEISKQQQLPELKKRLKEANKKKDGLTREKEQRTKEAY
jgi:hypothetical protein